MNSKKIAACALALTMSVGTVASFTGCSSDDNNSSTTGTTNAISEKAGYDIDKDANLNGIDGKGATLTVYTNRTDRCDDGYFKKMVEPFEKKTNCKVEFKGLTDYTGDIKKKMTTKDYGDVLMIPSDVKTDELANYFEPLGKYDDYKDKYRWADQKMTSDKTVYGLATAGTTVGILYNTKVWKDAGITELPKTPEDFIADLKQIKEKTDAVPYYTEFKDGWCTAQWANLVLSASGDPAYKNKLLTEKTDIFDEKGGYYKVYKLLVDVYSDKDLIEDDHNTDWEGSKEYLPQGKIASIVLGNWAVAQFKEKAENPEDVGYMPVPITAEDGKQYAQTSPDYFMGVSKNSENKELAKAFVTWFIDGSGYDDHEEMISTVVGADLPSALSEFKNVEWFDETPAPDGYVGIFDTIDDKSELRSYGDTNDNFKIKLAQAAFDGKGEETFKSIVEEYNKKWATARDAVLKEKGLEK